MFLVYTFVSHELRIWIMIKYKVQIYCSLSNIVFFETNEKILVFIRRKGEGGYIIADKCSSREFVLPTTNLFGI